jgi:hypothetical protein
VHMPQEDLLDPLAALPPAGVHDCARTVRNAKWKAALEIVPLEQPPVKPNEIQQGEHTLLMQPQPLAEVYPFMPTLREWYHSIPVDCGSNWLWDIIQAAVQHGPHPTVCTPKLVALFADNIAYQTKAAFCKVFLWDNFQCTPPANLKISTVAVVLQVGCRCCIILDLSFPVYQELDGVVTISQDSVNDLTLLTAPSTPFKEIGKVLPRLLQYMQDTPAGIRILFCKLDISNGFWCLVV